MEKQTLKQQCGIYLHTKYPYDSMPAIITVDKLVFENCFPYDVTHERVDIVRILEITEEEFSPLSDDIISSVCQDIHN